MTPHWTSRPGPASGRSGARRGFALLVVLWALALLALLVTQAAGTARTQAALAANIRDAAIVQAAADGAVNEAILRLLQGRLQPDGVARKLRVAGIDVAVEVEDEQVKLNVNFAPVAVLRALLIDLGVAADRAGVLARNISDWHRASPVSAEEIAPYREAGLPYGPAHARFSSLEQLRLVLGMTDDVMRRLRQVVSVYQSGLSAADAGSAAGTALAEGSTTDKALRGIVLPSDASLVVRIAATARSPGGAQAWRNAVVRLHRTDDGLGDPPAYVMRWDGVRPDEAK